MFVFTGTAFPQSIFFQEQFEGGVPPAGWTVVDNEGTGVVWTTIAGSGEAGNFTNGSGEAACVSSDIFGPAEFDTELRTPVLDFTNVTGVTLSFTANYQNFASLDFFDVDVSTDGGTNWTNIISWNEDHGGFRGLPGEDVSLSISALVEGQNNVVIRFHCYDPNLLDWDWYAQVDDLLITLSDADGDGVADCNDGCPHDPDKTDPGVCGCGVPDTDADGDGIPDCLLGQADTDYDGVGDLRERGPNGDNPHYDGNNDGTPDRLQAHVVSFTTYAADGPHYLTLEAPSDQRFTYAYTVRTNDPPPPPGVSLPYGFFSFGIMGMDQGGSTTVTLYLDGPPPQSYYKYGKTPQESWWDHWYEFSYNGTTGAEKAGDTLMLHLTDGDRGDHDLTANGSITDPGGPAAIEPREVLCFPHLVTGTGEETTLGIINTEAYEVDGEIAYYGENGNLLSSDTLILPPRGKLTLSPEEIPSGAASAIITADGGLVGYTRYVNPQGQRCAWPGATSWQPTVSVPHVATGEAWRTGLALTNLTDTEITVTMEDEAGMRSTLTLPSHAHSFTWLTEEDQGLTSLEATGRIGAVEVFESLSSEGDRAALLLENHFLTSLYVPSLCQGAGAFTGVGIGGSTRESTVWASVCRQDGTIEQYSLGELAPRCRMACVLSGICPEDTLWAKIKGETGVSIPFGPLPALYQGLLVYGEEDSARLGSVHLNTLRFTDGVLGVVISDTEPTFSLVNPGDDEAALLVTAYGTDGTVLGSSTVQIGAGQHLSGGLSTLLEGASLDGVTHIRISSDRNLYGCERIDTEGRMEMLPILKID